MMREKDREIKKMAKQNYISSGSRDILIKAGVDLSKQARKNYKAGKHQSDTEKESEFSFVDEGPRLLNQGHTLNSHYDT